MSIISQVALTCQEAAKDENVLGCAIADDGKSATYVIRITCVSSDMDDYLTVKI